MPKAERGTPKDLANRMKAKGLQKLKFYCQMCQKQCRDANGFKCHLTSDSHLRQMQLFAQHAGAMLDGMSKEFERTYLGMLRMRHGTKRVNANNVYQEVIQDKHHIHMNATKWTTLSIFVQYLGKTGKCVVEETERGWYVSYIERDPELLARREAQERRAQAEKQAEEVFQRQVEKQRREAAKKLGENAVRQTTDMEERKESVAIAFNSGKEQGKKRKLEAVSVFGDDDDDDDDDEDEGPPPVSVPLDVPVAPPLTSKRSKPKDKKPTTKQEPIDDDRPTNKEEPSHRKENWIRKGILVRIISKQLANGAYFKRKAVVDRVLEDDKFTAQVEVLDSGPDRRDGGDVLQLDQDDLETVVPKEGKMVKIVNGEGRGKTAKLLKLNPQKYTARLELTNGTILKKVAYEDFSKLAS